MSYKVDGEVFRKVVDDLAKKIAIEGPVSQGGSAPIVLTKPECDAILSLIRGGVHYHFHPAQGQHLRAVGDIVVIGDVPVINADTIR